MGFIFSFIIIIVFIGLFVFIAVLGFLRTIFSIGKRKNTTDNEQKQPFKTSKNKSKVFENTEGEYVDYEEIK